MKKSPVYQISMRLAIGSIEQAMKDYSDAVTLGRVVYNYDAAEALTGAWLRSLQAFGEYALAEEATGDE